jgi:hypothetical protein
MKVSKTKAMIMQMKNLKKSRTRKPAKSSSTMKAFLTQSEGVYILCFKVKEFLSAILCLAGFIITFFHYY